LIPGGIRAAIKGVVATLDGFPTLPLALALLVVLGRPFGQRFIALVLAFALVQISAFIQLALRLMRPASASGALRFDSPALWSHVAQAPIAVALVTLWKSAMSFLGFGLPHPTPEWGAMLGDALPTLITGGLWQLLGPALALGLCVFGLTLLGEDLRFLLEQPHTQSM
jgi:peptide/nickel transport system permease protein